MKILITGGCGFLGSNLAAHYLEQGAEVVIIDSLVREGSRKNLQWLRDKASEMQLTFVCGDLANEGVVKTVFQLHAPFHFICHVGGQVAMTTSISDPRRDMLTNIVGTFNVLEATRELSPEAFVAYSSTNKVYGDLETLSYEEKEFRYCLSDYRDGLDETLPLDFSTPYGCSKGSADQYVRDWYRMFGIKTVVFRHSSIYGGRQFSSFDQGWIGWFCKKAVEQKMATDSGKKVSAFSISGTGKQVRDVLHAKDIISLYETAYKHRDKIAGEVFNIGGGTRNSLSLLELFLYLSNLVGLDKLEFKSGPRRKSDQNVFIANIGKVCRFMPWMPSVTFEDGVSSMTGWVRSTSENAS